jgi:hypothetical protein
MANRAQKLNRFIVRDFDFENLKELLMRLDITDKLERIYNIDEIGFSLSFFFLEQRFVTSL